MDGAIELQLVVSILGILMSLGGAGSDRRYRGK